MIFGFDALGTGCHSKSMCQADHRVDHGLSPLAVAYGGDKGLVQLDDVERKLLEMA